MTNVHVFKAAQARRAYFFPFWSLSGIYQIGQVLKIHVVTKEATYSFLPWLSMAYYFW